MPRPCNTCDRDDTSHEVWMPIFGTICPECVRRLSLPTHREGCVTGEPLVATAWKYVSEFERRRQALLGQAREVCE